MDVSFGKANDGHIFCADLQGREVKTVVLTGMTHTSKQMAMDPVNRKICW